jgi:hypothetical protein
VHYFAKSLTFASACATFSPIFSFPIAVLFWSSIVTDTENQEEPNKEIMDAILQVMEGGNPEEIAQKVGMPPEQLVALSDSFVQQHYQTSLLGEAADRKIGRNEPCPCGSGNKYKKCCLRKHEKIKDLLRGSVDFQ